MFATLGQAAQNWASGKIGHGGWHILTYEPQPHLFYISCHRPWNMEAATTKNDGGYRNGGWWGLKISGGPQGGLDGRRWERRWPVGFWEQRGGAEKQVERPGQEEQKEAHHHHTDLRVWSVSKATYHPATPTTPHYLSTTPALHPATPHPALPLTANYRISLDRAPKCRPLFARRSKYLSRDIYYHYTNKGVTLGHGTLTPDYPT